MCYVAEILHQFLVSVVMWALRNDTFSCVMLQSCDGHLGVLFWGGELQGTELHWACACCRETRNVHRNFVGNRLGKFVTRKTQEEMKLWR